MQASYQATENVNRVIANLGRTEDIKFSPNNKRLAIAEFANSKIAVLGVRIVSSSAGLLITLPYAFEISSTRLKEPHGLTFLDDDRIIVANRDRDICIFEIPPRYEDGDCYDLPELECLGCFEGIFSPGSVAVIPKANNLFEAFICNNYSNNVTRHWLEITTRCTIHKNDILLREWLEIPDGICISNDGHWIAVSNHSTHCVLLYKDIDSLNEKSSPDGILGSVSYPHGLNFTSDGKFILVADAGSPNVHVYAKGHTTWQGVRNPLMSFAVMEEDNFLRGRYNPQEGGPKGIDISKDMAVFVTTSEHQPLAFFNLQAILDQIMRDQDLRRRASGALEQV